MGNVHSEQIVYIAVGSNHLREESLRAAYKAMQTLGTVVAASSLYESAAVGDAAPPYWNGVVKLATPLAGLALKARLRRIEDAAGRVRRLANGQRSPLVTLDLDVLLAAGQPPHPDLYERAYVVVPMAEIAPEERPDAAAPTFAALAQAHAAALRRLPDADLQALNNA
jgi:2-amino-4-hydroxy-6-hydroxymethyldihydropteridine diphosphokinase